MDLGLNFDPYNFILCLVVDICMQCLFFVIAVVLQFDKIADFAGGINFIIIALLTHHMAEVSELSWCNFELEMNGGNN